MEESARVFPFTYIFLNNTDTIINLNTDTMNFTNVEDMRRNPKSYAFNISMNDDKLLLTELKNFEGSTIFCLSQLKPSLFYARVDSLSKSLNITVNLGYNLLYSYHSIVEMRKVLSIYNAEFLYNKLYREFFENKDIGYSFVGPLRLGDMFVTNDPSEDYIVFNAYCRFAVKFNVPILIDMADRDDPAGDVQYLISRINEVDVDKIKKYWFLFNYSVKRVEKTIYSAQGFAIENSIVNYDEILELLNKRFNIGIGIENFRDVQDLANFVEYLDEKQTKYLFISPTLRFKTHLNYYGNSSTSIFGEALRTATSSKGFEQIFIKNPKQLFKEKKKEIIAPKPTSGFTCPICSKQSLEINNKISKDGQNFCSIDCFRVYIKQPK